MSKYEYEIAFNTKDFEDFLQKKSEFDNDVKTVIDKYKDELNELGIDFDDSYSFDFEKHIAKVKPIPETLPENLRKELHDYFSKKCFQ